MMPRSTPAQPRTSDAAGWATLVFITLALVLIQWQAPMEVETLGLLKVGVACIVLAGTSRFYRQVRPNESFAMMCTGLMQVVLFSSLAAVLSYALARQGGALWDARLQAWDRSLGFDWLAYVRWVDDHRPAALILRNAYASLVPQVIVIILALGFGQRTALLRQILLAAMISGTVIVLLSPLFPAVSNFVHLQLTATDFRFVDSYAGYSHLAHYNALRNGDAFVVKMGEMQGIITFPSYHAGLATVTFWGFWQSGIRLLRPLGCTIALLTILATPVDGGHYLVDIIAGIAIGALSILAAGRAVRWTPEPLPRLTAWPSRRSRAAFVP